MAATVEVVPQRWARPEVFHAPPGFWKQQLRGKGLKLAARGDLPSLRVLLRQDPGAINRRGSHGRTLLWEAVRAGKRDAVRFLIEAGADANVTGSYNSESYVQLTPYCAARYYKRAGIADYLGARSATQDVFRAAFMGDRRAVERQIDQRPDLLDAEDPHDLIYFVPLIAFPVAAGQAKLAQALIDRGARLAPYSAQLLNLAATSARLTARVVWIDLLVAGGVDPHATPAGAFLSDAAVARRLLELGAPVNRVSENGFTPLIYLARGDKGSRLDLMQLLLDFGADVDAIGPHGRTALHYAAAAGNADMVALLLANGADSAAVDVHGDTPSVLARRGIERMPRPCADGDSPHPSATGNYSASGEQSPNS